MSFGTMSKKETTAVKLDKDLVRKAKVIATARGGSMSDYLSAMLRPHIDKDYPKAIQKLNEEEQRGRS